MKSWLPFPGMSAMLLLTWLLLEQDVSVQQLLMGTFLAIAVPLLVRPLQPLSYPRLRRPLALIRLLRMAVAEIVRSCFSVSGLILFPRRGGVNARFMKIPLDLRSPYGLAVLSGLINLTPGTVWVEILPGRHELVLHVLDLHDERWWIDTIKQRYEQPLRDIFEGGKG
jgi:multicomponent K+:H+ antiporter subunit E